MQIQRLPLTLSRANSMNKTIVTLAVIAGVAVVGVLVYKQIQKNQNANNGGLAGDGGNFLGGLLGSLGYGNNNGDNV